MTHLIEVLSMYLTFMAPSIRPLFVNFCKPVYVINENYMSTSTSIWAKSHLTFYVVLCYF